MRPILWYLAFVGLPVVALLGILRLGEGLVPPRAAHGRYAVVLDSSGVSPCLAPLLDGDERVVTVIQSGPRLELTLGRERVITLAGTVAGDTIRAAGAANCLTTDSIVVLATLEKRATETQLVGRFQLPGCTTCAPASFRARRLPSQ